MKSQVYLSFSEVQPDLYKTILIYDRHFTIDIPDLRIPRRDRERKHLARDRRLHPPGHRRPAGHRNQRDRVQHHPLLEGNERQYRFLYDIQQRNVDDHSNVILQLMARSMVDGATSSLTLAIGPATRTRAGVLTAEDYIRIQGIGETNDAVKTVVKNDNRD